MLLHLKCPYLVICRRLAGTLFNGSATAKLLSRGTASVLLEKERHGRPRSETSQLSSVRYTTLAVFRLKTSI